jgi:RNA polymerase sigma-70 factor, ECF subfamily
LEPKQAFSFETCDERPNMSKTPASLLERLRQPNDRVAWERFVKLYTPLLYHWVHHLGAHGAEADDLVQDVFTTLVQKLPQFHYDPTQTFRGWLWTITKNQLRKCRRKRHGAGAIGLEEAAVPDPAEAIDEDEYRQFLTRRALELMQAEFEPSTWQAFWQFVVEGRPGADVARALGLSVNAVYIAKARVLRRLKQELAGLLD